MIPMIEEVAVREGWIASASDCTVGWDCGRNAGTVAVNIATLLGFQNAGFSGHFCHPRGHPAFLDNSCINRFVRKEVIGNQVCDGGFKGLRPVVIGLITVVVIGLIYQNLFQTGLDLWNLSAQGLDYFSLIIGILVFGVSLIKIKQKALSPIFLIILSGVLGIIFYQVVGL